MAKQKVDFNDVNREDFELETKLRTTLKDLEEKAEKRDLSSENELHLLEENIKLQENQQESKRQSFLEADSPSQSLLSESHPIHEKDYSPENYLSFEENQKKQLEEDEIISSNRFKFFFYLFLFIYLFFLGIGYKNTLYIEDQPQITSFEIKAEEDFLNKMETTINDIQNIHMEIILLTENYSDNLISEIELGSKIKTYKEKLVKIHEETKDALAPESKEHLKSLILETILLQISYIDNTTVFLQNKKEEDLTKIRQINKTYETKINNVLKTYNDMFVTI